MYVCVCVCVCVRERERERETDSIPTITSNKLKGKMFISWFGYQTSVEVATPYKQ